ncbi:UNVERIFIED_CONTAM: hypothetical protein GTU68_054660, partial [Idotea baltica]|nr:hypothetical protein [Idotea baltica]
MAKAKIVISGASGLIGKKLVARLSQSYDVYRLERTKSSDSKSIYWNWKTEEVESEKLESIHSLIHLAGEPIASGRWSEAKKQRILDSRVGGTSFLAKVISKLKDKPKSFISASAIGYYGETGDHTATEITPAGDGFLSEVCLAWENTSQAASVAGIRVVNPRIGIVLSAEGGALAQMLPIFKFYLGGALGSGSQYM